MYYNLNEPQMALETFKDPELEGFFDQLTTYQILCDLLYTNKMYNEILELFEIIKTKQVQGSKFPRNVIILVFGACFEMVMTLNISILFVTSYSYPILTLFSFFNCSY